MTKESSVRSGVVKMSAHYSMGLLEVAIYNVAMAVKELEVKEELPPCLTAALLPYCLTAWPSKSTNHVNVTLQAIHCHNMNALAATWFECLDAFIFIPDDT
jgi:hypothetical protein